MPITYKIDADKSTIRTKAVGHLTLQEVVDHFRTLEQDPEVPKGTDVFLDLSEPCPLLCRALPLFVVGVGLGGFLPGSSGVFQRGQEKWTVVTAHAFVAPR